MVSIISLSLHHQMNLKIFFKQRSVHTSSTFDTSDNLTTQYHRSYFIGKEVEYCNFIFSSECLCSPLLIHWLHSPSMHPWGHKQFSKSTDSGRGDLGLVYRWFCPICRHHTKVDRSDYSRLMGHPWRRRKTFPVGRTPSSVPGGSLCFKGEMARYTIIYQLTGFGQCFGWMFRDLQRIRVETWWQGTWGKT